MLHGLKYDFIEDLLINLRLLKPPPAVLAENGVMRYRIGQRKTNKPTVGDVDPDFLNEASFRTNSVQITDQKHFEQHDRIDARTPIILTIQGAAFFRDKRKVDGFIDFSKQVILGNKVFYVDCFGLKFPGWVRPEHIKTFLRNCFIPNSTKKAVDPSLSTASAPDQGAFLMREKTPARRGSQGIGFFRQNDLFSQFDESHGFENVDADRVDARMSFLVDRHQHHSFIVLHLF